MTEKKRHLSFAERQAAYDKAHPEENVRLARLKGKAGYWTGRAGKAAVSTGKRLSVHLSESLKKGIIKAKDQGQEAKAVAGAKDFVEQQLVKKGMSPSEAHAAAHSQETDQAIRAYVEVPKGATITIKEGGNQ
jgi:hypothetical protein